jgi:hypothetical protein
MAREGARYALHRGVQNVLIVATPGLADAYTATPAARAQYAERLGARADALAQADPLLAPARLTEELKAVPSPEGDPQLMPDRLLRLAVATSQQAALSSRMELYPRGAAPPDSRDWRNLQILVRRAIPAVEQTLFAADRPVLLVYPGLLARYDQIPLLEKLRDACTQQRHAPGFLVLVPSDEQRTMPVLDGKPVPVILASEWARIPDAWLINAHRAQEV